MPLPEYAAVVLPLPLDVPFHYRIPPALQEAVAVGKRVRVPFRSRVLVGTVIARVGTPEVPHVRDILEVVDPEPLVGPALLELTRWMAEYYLCGWGEALAAAVPASVRKQRPRKTVDVLEPAATPEAPASKRAELVGRRQAMGRALDTVLRAGGEAMTFAELCRRAHVSRGPVLKLLAEGLLRKREVEVAPDWGIGEDTAPPEVPAALTPHQAEALAAFRALVPAGGGKRCLLLHGVTGSGKTEVYLRAIADVIAAGRQAIMLVPEIALTPQTVARFRARIPRLAVLHSVLTESDRAAQWADIRAGKVDVVVGARSALFAPVPRLGLVVIDEEHETGYKQENDPRYHAREAALRRAAIEDAAVILGSATPSLESWHAAAEGRYRLARLPERIGGRPLPPVEIVDLAGEFRATNAYPVLSRRLEQDVRDALGRKEQVLLFLNRRGFAPLVTCPSCKWVMRCARCDIALTYHKLTGRALCHYCYAEAVVPETCPECAGHRPRIFGMGTERVEEAVRVTFPEARVARMDSDAMQSRHDYRAAFEGLASGAIDILVGTQMIAKGFDVPNVTLVGVVSADTAFWLPDFRSAERTFQLVMQVAGRAGRGPKGGRVVVQTFNPDHYSLVHAARHDYEGFAKRELEERRSLGYPPFTHLVRVVCQGARLERTREAAQRLRDDLGAALREDTGRLLGPVPAPIAQIRGRHRLQLLVKTENLEFVQHEMRKIRSHARTARDVQVVVDVDPMGMM